MAELTARFRMIDEMSAALERVAQSGQDMTDRIGQGAADLDSAMGGISSRVVSVARTIDGVATSLDQAQASQTNLTAAIERAAQTTEELSENENVSVETKERLAQATQEAENALNDLAAAQERTQQAMDEYDRLLASGTENLDELEQAAQNAANASEELEEANRRAADATQELSDATDQAADEAENGSNRGQKAAEQLAAALTSAGIAKLVLEVASAYMQASEAAAEFEVVTMKISTIADTSQVSLSDISKELLSLSMATGQSVNGLSEATYSALSASVETASAVEFTATATKLAAGGFTSSATAVDVLTTALNAYKLEAGQAENIADMLVTTQNLGKTTVDELAASVGKVIPLASAYGVEMDNLSAAYAELTKGGIATAESGTYLKAMLNELGKSSSTVSAVLLKETGSTFASLMEQGYSLGDVMAVLGESVGGNAGAFNELWSSSEAGIGALSLYNAGAEQFNATLNAMQTSIGATNTAYETMTDTTAHAKEELSNAAANLQISIGQQINPLMDRLYTSGTNILNFMTEFSQDHPMVVKAVSAIGVGLGVAAVAMVGVTVATTTAIPAIVSFGTALNAALGPIGWVAVGITALVAAGAALVGMLEEDMGETEGMTAATREQYYELKNLTSEYEAACEQYGETSEEASRLKYQVDDLSATFEANRQTVEEFTAEVDALCESVSSIADNFDTTMSSIQAQETGAMALIQKYDDLASKADRTAAEEQALEAVNKKLAASYPEIAASMDSASMSTEDYVAAMRRAAEAEAEEQRQQQAQETYIEALQKRAELTDELAKAQENVNLEQARMDEMSGWEHFWTGGEWDDLEAYQAALEELNAAMAENDAVIAEIEGNWEAAALAEQEAAAATMTWQEAAANAYETVREKVEELCAAYDEAYQAAVDSFAGQFGLFDEASMKSDEYMNSTVSNAQKAMESQLAYWESYGANVETLKNTSAADLGITQENYEALMAYAQDGSEQAAGLAASMAQAIEAGDTEAVAALANTIAEVTAKQEEIAATTADWQTGFTEQMDAIEQEMQDTVDGMNLSEEAAASATATINSYTEQILAGKADAVAAAKEVASAVSAALSTTGTSAKATTTTTVEGNAAGTTDSADIFMAGEDGPELIVGKAHSTVFPASETDRLINAVSSAYDNSVGYPEVATAGTVSNAGFSANEPDNLISAVTSNYDNRTTNNYALAPADTVAAGSQNNGEQSKHITLEIAGGAPITVSGGGGTSKEEIVEILVSNLRPALLDIVKDEIFEEGDGSYEY